MLQGASACSVHSKPVAVKVCQKHGPAAPLARPVLLISPAKRLCHEGAAKYGMALMVSTFPVTCQARKGRVIGFLGPDFLRIFLQVLRSQDLFLEKVTHADSSSPTHHIQSQTLFYL